jgi:transposase
MIYAKVNDYETLEKELVNAKDINWYKRLKIIQLSSQGISVPQLAQTFDICQATVRDYIERYNDGGIATLKREYSKGRPSLIKLNKTQWEELLHQSPCQFEKLNTGARNWTQKLLVDYCSQYLDIQLTRSTISIMLKNIGISWNRGKLKVTSPDPLYTLKRERVDELKKSQIRDIK